LTILVSAPILAIGGIIMALREDATLSWLIVVIVPLMAAVIGVLLWKAVPLFRQVQVKIDRITQVLREQITGVRVVRAFIRVRSEQVRFETANADLTATSLRVDRILALAFADVTFAYPHGERPVLRGLTFEARPGRTTAIIGGTGSGKSTVVSLVTRSFDVTSGVVLVDGLDVREQALDGLWSRIGLVPQTAYLLDRKSVV